MADSARCEGRIVGSSSTSGSVVLSAGEEVEVAGGDMSPVAFDARLDGPPDCVG